MKRLNGFSLMEMMIVLTIVAIVAAASAPMVNKKMVRAASEKSPWIFTNGESIAYNLDNPNGIQDNKTARIGSGSDAPNGAHPRLYITTNSDATPHIMFGRNDNSSLMRLTAGGDNANLWLNNRAVPDAANATVALGWNSNAAANRAVAVGMDSDAQSPGSVAMGNNAKARAQVSIAIGDGAKAGFEGGNDANKFSAIAIGSEAIARPVRSIAIGRHAEATGNGSIAMGSSGDDGTNNRARAQGASSIAIGQSAFAQQNNSIALGGSAQATGQTSIAISGSASANDSISIGRAASAASNETLALGLNARATGDDGIALGRNSQAGASAIAIGSTGPNGDTRANAAAAIAIGDGPNASANFATAIGGMAAATAANTIAIGTGANASFERSVAIGYNAQTKAANTIVLGDENTTVVIPGAVEFSSLHITKDLVVDQNCVVNRLGGEFIFRAQPGPPDEKSKYSSSQLSRIFMGDDKGGDDNTRTLRKYGWKYTIMGYTISSDRRLKNVGKEFTSGLDKIKKLEVFNYTFKDDKDKTPRVGVMAQDLQKVFPDAVVKGEDGFLRIRMEDMFYAVINAVKELDSRISLLEQKQKQIDELEKRVDKLEKQLADLEKKVK